MMPLSRIVRPAILGLLLFICAAAPPVIAQTAPQAGLMWNRSGLPAVFPLQVKTPPGHDYFLRLIDANTGKAVLAAYIDGGAFFKVLVPPGEFRLRFAAGTGWQGEDDLFGPGAETDLFDLREPLTFETRGIGVKAGHVVSLMEREPGRLAQITRKDQLICQSLRQRVSIPARSEFDRTAARDIHDDPNPASVRARISAGHEARIVPASRHSEPRHSEHRERNFVAPRYKLQARYCG